jgi:hypothetical protein
MKSFREDEKKLSELILYISQKCANDPCFGATKLNKILFFSDFLFYGNTGKPITGVEYQKLPHGPAPRRLLPIRKKLESQGALGVQPVNLRSGNVQHKLVNLRPPDLSLFSGEEIATIDSVIEGLRKDNAESVSELSHRMVGWRVVEVGEVIPYTTVFISNAPLSESEIIRGREIASKLVAA